MLLRYFLFLIMISCFGQLAKSQPPGIYADTIKRAYVRAWEFTAPLKDPVQAGTKTVRDVKQITQYFDGKGRSIQKVARQAAMETGRPGYDLVSPAFYDKEGREAFTYLPFAANNNGGNASVNDGNFKRNPFQQQTQFWADYLPGESNYYSKVIYEASPLGRVLKVMPSGVSWAGSNRGVEKKNLTNTINDSVKIWKVTDNAEFGTYNAIGNYAPGELYKTISTNEMGVQVIEYKDLDQRMILRKVQLGAAPDPGTGSGHNGWVCTYYLYDQTDNLRCIVQPKGVELITGNWGLTDQSILDEQCFRYAYDKRRRIILKQVPGGGINSLVYDARDRMVFLQDANGKLRNEWQTTLYDIDNREVLTGLINFTGTREALQSLVNTSTSTSSVTEPNTIIEGVTINRNPLPAGSQLYPLEVTYFDNYDWAAGLNNALKTFEVGSISGSLIPASNNIWPYAQPLAASSKVLNAVTGKKIRLLKVSPDKFLVSVYFYDSEGRTIQERSDNISGGIDAVSTQYSWNGSPLVVVKQHSKNGLNPQTHLVVKKMNYDDLGRLLNANIQVSGTIGGVQYLKPQQELFSLQYDALGRVRKKLLGSPVIDSLEVDYNIRGWVTGVNRNSINNSSSHFFGYELGYDKSTSVIPGSPYKDLRYDGSISGMIWRSKGDNEKRRYDFVYDKIQRLTAADFNQYTNGAFNKQAKIDYSVSNLTYDINGNHQTLTQKGWKPGGSDVIDSLEYSYYNNSNKLRLVLDRRNDPQTTLGDFRSSQAYLNLLGGTKTGQETDYSYDGNGNLTKDLNKDVGTPTGKGISYNLLNLPDTIVVGNGSGQTRGTIVYTYDASGKKWVTNSSEAGRPAKITSYIGDFVYENDTLQFINHEEGRLRFTKKGSGNGSFDIIYTDYFIRDHLDNVRMVLTDQIDTSVYKATMEPSVRNFEDQLFANLSSSSYPTALVSGYPSDTSPNDSLARLNGSGKKIGPSILLKVMAGDQFTLAVKSFFKQQNRENDNNPVNEILSLVSSGIVGLEAGGKGTASQLGDVNNSPLLGALGMFRQDKNADSTSKPKAYLNWILFDEQFAYVGASSGASPVTLPDQLQYLNGQVSISKNGYLFVYVSNETSNWNVYFDDLSVHHVTGKILEETHYYPFGLIMKGISSRAFGRTANKIKYNGIELNDEFDLHTYEAFYRTLDPQIGRWWQIDPRIEDMQSWSPYASNFNNPVLFNDKLGDYPGGGTPYKGGIRLFEVADYLKLVPGGQSRPGEMFELGGYSILPNYVENANGQWVFSHYTASIMIKDIQTMKNKGRIDWIFGKEDLESFKKNVQRLGAGAGLMYGAGSKLALWQIKQMAGENWFKDYLKAVYTDPMQYLAAAHVIASPARNIAPKPTETPAPTVAYNRKAHYGNTPKKSDRVALNATKADVVDHKVPLVKHYYEGDGKGGKPGYQMTKAERVAFANERKNMQLQPKAQSNAQGGQMSNYSKQKKKQYGL